MGSPISGGRRRSSPAGDVARARLEALTEVTSGDDDPGTDPTGTGREDEPVERPARMVSEMIDVEAWREPPWWRRIRVAPGPAAGIGLIVVVLVVAAVVLWRIDDGSPDYSDVDAPDLPFATGTGEGTVADAALQEGSDADADPGPGAGASAGQSPADEHEGDDTEPLVVSVVGLVERSGLVTLPPDSRVAHALDAAGGTLPGADREGLNLARRLTDGEQVLVGTEPTDEHPGARSAILGPDGDPVAGAAAGEPGAPAAGHDGGAGADGGSSDPVDINEAGDTELQTLPGVGPATAAAILAWRRDNGRFSGVEQLIEVSGIGPATLERLRPLVTA